MKPPDAEIAAVYEWAISYAARRAGGPWELADAATDAATDALLWAAAHYRPDRGKFAKFAKAIVCRRVAGAIARTRRLLALRPVSLTADPVAPPTGAGEVPAPVSFGEIPEEFREVARIYYVEGRGLAESARLLGIEIGMVRGLLRGLSRFLSQGSESDGINRPDETDLPPLCEPAADR